MPTPSPRPAALRLTRPSRQLSLIEPVAELPVFDVASTFGLFVQYMRTGDEDQRLLNIRDVHAWVDGCPCAQVQACALAALQIELDVYRDRQPSPRARPYYNELMSQMAETLCA